MIPKRSRLPFSEFRARGYRTIATPFFSLKLKGNTSSANRIGVVVGTAVAKSAAKRNFFRRQANNILGVTSNKQKDILLVLYPGVSKLTRKQFRNVLTQAITKTTQ